MNRFYSIIRIALIALIPIVIIILIMSCDRSKRDVASKISADEQKITDEVISRFEILASVPRPSGHEKKISNTLKKWAGDQGFKVKQNKVYDLVIDVPATEGQEKKPLVILQAHMDMVTVADDGVDYDPVKDPIKLLIDKEKGTMTADGTSLGADDGIGVAMIMAIAEGNMEHGPLRLIFTADEEAGMSGAMAITKKDLGGAKYLINIDGEESDAVTVSSAAGVTVVSKGTPEAVPVKGDAALEIEMTGLRGGHSGVTIHEGKANAIVSMGEILTAIGKETKYQLASFTGGQAENAIPKSADAVITVAAKDREKVGKIVEEKKKELSKKYKGIEESIEVAVSERKGSDRPSEAIDDASRDAVLVYLDRSIDGVSSMSEDVEGLVESSCNIGLIDVSPEKIYMKQLVRSSEDDKLSEIEHTQTALGKSLGLSSKSEDGVGAWPVKDDSKLMPLVQKIYREQNGEDIRVVGIHGALECGEFSALSDDLDIVSIGPEVKDVHSPDETVYLDSIPKTWNLLKELLLEV